MLAIMTINDQIGPTIPPGDPIKGFRMIKRRKP
jgi:hypothetical protein